jgi:hypothetical protein
MNDEHEMMTAASLSSNHRYTTHHAIETNTSQAFLAKIDCILQDTRKSDNNSILLVAHRSERYLVALVLLTRVSSLDEEENNNNNNNNNDENNRYNEILRKFWSRYQEKLVQFAVRLLSKFENVDDGDASTNHDDVTFLQRVVYSRLVANLALKIPAVYYESLDTLGKALVEILSSLNEHTVHSSSAYLTMEIELVKALDRIASAVWNGKEDSHQETLGHALTVLASQCQATTTTTPTTTPLLEKRSYNSVDHDTNVMIQTLDALLQQKAVVDDNGTDEKNVIEENTWEVWTRTMATFFQRHAPQHCNYSVKSSSTKIPTYYPILLTLIGGNNNVSRARSLSLETQHAWYEVLLLSTQALADGSCRQQYLQRESDHNHVLLLPRLLLALVSSPSSDDRLRSQAWTTMAILIETMGFDWTVTSKTTTTTTADISQSSKKPTWCTLVCLGSAEWRIQVSRHATEALDKAIPDPQQQPTEAYHDTPTIQLLIESCGRFLLAVLAWAGRVADDEDGDSRQGVNVPLSSDALLTLRHSLDDAANVVVRFLTLPERQAAQCSPQIHGIACRVLGGLLTELDVWEDFPRCGVSTRQVLQALRVAMTTSADDPNMTLTPFLVPALLTLLQTVEDDQARLELLRRAGILTDKRFVPVACNVFTTLDLDVLNVVPFACQLIELWLSLVPPIDTTRLKRTVINWIRQRLIELNKGSSSKLLTEALSSAVGCFITLQGDTIPGDEDSDVIECALQYVGPP